MNIKLLEQYSLRKRIIPFKNVRFLKIIEVNLKFLEVTLCELINIARALLLLDPLSVLEDVQHIFVELIAKIPVQV